VADLQREVNRLCDAVAALRQDFTGTLIVSTPPYPIWPGFQLLDSVQPSPGLALFHQLAQTWASRLARIERVRQLDLQGLVLNSGLKAVHDQRKWYLYRQPYSDGFWLEIGELLGRLIAAETREAKKCVVLDLDNTLWGGIIGEDGLEGIQLGQDFPGLAYQQFQRYLLWLKTRGVLLAVASRNNPEDALEVFDRHDAMVLTRRDIAAFEIHWDSKVESLKRVAARLNIGIDALVFVDDNPKEIAEVAERLPDVTCVLVPEEIALLPALLAETGLFDVAEITDEDRRRTEMITADGMRQEAQESMSEEEFLRSLNLHIRVFAAHRQHLARTTQLINKSNQFNLTTIRRTADEVAELAADPESIVLCMDISDKFGDYGLVGVSILRREAAACRIDTLLMSCRVLGRGAEATFLAKITDAARSLGCIELRGAYIPTRKNGMVADLYRRFGFTRDEERDEWVFTLDRQMTVPDHVLVSFDLSAHQAVTAGATAAEGSTQPA
jgi:FkbH-like protein